MRISTHACIFSVTSQGRAEKDEGRSQTSRAYGCRQHCAVEGFVVFLLCQTKRILTLPFFRACAHSSGTVACVISTCDELLATELLLGGAFNNLDPAVAAAMVSCMAFNEPGEEVCVFFSHAAVHRYTCVRR